MAETIFQYYRLRHCGCMVFDVADTVHGGEIETVALCGNCRRHIEIGRAVEGMPVKSTLFRGVAGWECGQEYDMESATIYNTPLEALTKGGKHGD